MKADSEDSPDGNSDGREAGAGRGAQKVNRRRERLFYTGTVVVFVLVISHPLRLVVGNTQAWLAFVTWLTDWVG